MTTASPSGMSTVATPGRSTATPADPPRRFVGIAVSGHAGLQPLPDAEADARALGRLLAERHGYRGDVLVDPTREQLQDTLEPDSLPQADLVLVWIGHGRRGPDGGLQLLGTKANNVLGNAGDLGEWAAATGARQVLMLIDTCHAGGGLVPSIGQAFATLSGRSELDGVWFGVLAASRAEEQARAGALIGTFHELLRNGPRRPDPRWTPGQPTLRGDDVLATLSAEWRDGPYADDQTPVPMTAGSSRRPMLRNPRFDVGLGARPVEQLLQAARGGGEVESHFTGRVAQLTAIVGWLRARRPGVLAVVGPAGCGKSALLGRIASLSTPEERARLLQDAPVEAGLDPGVGTVHAQLQLSGATVEAASEQLARQLAVDPAQGLHGVLALAHERLERGDPLAVLLDGLDEAGTQAAAVAEELIGLLGREARVVVGARRQVFGEVDLAALKGVATEVVDLAQDPAGTLADVRRYVVLRLTGIAPAMDPEQVAEALTTGRGAEANAPFLLARLTTSQLRETPVDTSVPDWQRTLVTSAQSALEQDLRRASILREGAELPDAARELMAALAWAQGTGFPADELWPELATRLSRHGTRYTRDEVFDLLGQLGRHVVASVEGDQQVYRIAHQVLTDHLLAGTTPDTMAAVAAAVHEVWSAWIDAGHPPEAHLYLWRFAWLHLADAGADGLLRLERLAARDPALFRLDLALAYERAAARAADDGRIAMSLDWQERAVGFRRELGDPRRLVLALFRLSMIRGSTGDDAGADAAASEATTLARTLRSDRQARELVVGAWFARVRSLLQLARFDAARRWARELLDFLTEPRAADEPAPAPADAAAEVGSIGMAHLSVSAAALMQGDIAAAREHARLGVEAHDRSTVANLDPAPLMELLAAWAFAESQLAVSGGPRPGDAPIDLQPGLRLLAEHRRRSAAGKPPDAPTIKGLLGLARTLATGQTGGRPAAELPTATDLLEQTAALAADERFAAVAYLVTVRATALSMLAQIEAPTRPEAARNRLAGAIALLRELDGSGGTFVSYQIGECLDLMNAIELQASGGRLTEVLPRLPALLERQDEAVARLRTVVSPSTVPRLIEALMRLNALHQFASGLDAGAPARAEAIQLLRAHAASDNDRSLLAALLVDEAAHLLGRRSGEALACAEESLALLERLPEDPRTPLLRAFGLLNAAAARVVLDRLDGLGPLLDEAEGLMDALGDAPVIVAGRAAIALDQAVLALRGGRPQDALPRARRAVELYATAGLPPGLAADIPLAEIALGQAELESGAVDAGTYRLARVVEAIRALVVGGEPAAESRITRLVVTLEHAVPGFWPSIEDALRTHPALLARLGHMRRRPPEAWPALARELDDALAASPPERLRDLRQVVRMHRATDPERFDAVWRTATGALPDWLTIGASFEWSVIGWWNTPDWIASRDYLLAHPELLEPESDAVLDEMGLQPSAEGLAAAHRGLLGEARVHGIPAAYAPMLLRFELDRWIRSDDPQGHLARHPDLRRAEIGDLLLRRTAELDRDGAAFRAVWELLQRGEDALAFELLSDPHAGDALLPAAWRAADAPRLAALARLVWARQDGSRRRGAALALAIAEALEPTGVPLPPLRDELAGIDAAERASLVSAVTDAMMHHPGAVVALAGLVTTVHAAPTSSA